MIIDGSVPNMHVPRHVDGMIHVCLDEFDTLDEATEFLEAKKEKCGTAVAARFGEDRSWLILE